MNETTEGTKDRASPRRGARGPRRNPLLRVLLWGAGLVLVLLLAVSAVLVFKPSLVVEQIKDRALPQVSARLGRDVTAGEIDVSFFPPHATVNDVRIAGAAGEPPLLESGSATVTWKLWPLIRSFGRDIQIDSVSLNEPVVTLVRRADGTWSYEELSEHLEKTAPPEEPQAETVRTLHIAEFRIEDGQVRIIDQGAGAEAARVALTRLDVEADDIAPGAPLELSATGAFAAADENLKLELTVDPLPAGMGGAAQPETLPNLSGTWSLTNVPLQAFRAYFPASVGELITGGLVSVDGDLATEERRYVSEGRARLSSLRLRGEPASGEASFEATVNPDRPEAMVLQLGALSLKGPGIDLSGTARYVHSPRRAEFALKGPLLDLDALMGVLPEDEPAAAGAGEAPEPLLSASAREQLEATTVTGTLEVDKVVNGKLTATGLRAKARLQKGVLALEEAQANLYGGKVVASGTTVNLLPELPQWDLNAQVDGMNVAEAMGSLSDHQPLQGQMNLSLTLKGAGNEWEQLKKLVTGVGSVQVADGALTSANLAEQLRGPLSKGLARLGAKGVAEDVAAGQGTELKDLSAAFRVKDGWMVLTRPLSFNSRFGTAQLGGRIGLDQRLDLDGTVLLEPSFVASLTGNSLRPERPLQVPLEIGGDLRAPKLTGVDTRRLVTSAVPTEKVKEKVKDEAKKLEEEAKRRARKGLEGLFRR